MTKEQFKAKAMKVIDNEQFGCDEVLFDYKEINQMKVAQVDNWGDLENTMPFMNFIDSLYKQIKGDLTPTHGTCKDCKHCCFITGTKNRVCEKHGCMQVSNNWYCADFEKRGSESGL